MIHLGGGMYKNILVPLDGSQRAERILPHVKQLADRFEARIILVQVVEPHIEFVGSQKAHQDQAIEDFLQETDLAKVYLSSLKDQLKAEGVHALSQVVHGDVVKTILGIAKGWDVDLIAMASHGHTGLSRVFYGSVAAGILHQVNRSLFLIRAEGDEEQERKDVQMYKNILVPLDGSKRAERILPHVEELAFRFEANVVLLRVVGLIGSSTHPNVPFSKLDLGNEEQRYDDAKSYLTAIRGEFREKGIKAKAVLKKGPVVRWICDVASSEDVDLIAMASHGRTGLERVFYGSVAVGVLHQVDRPLLLIRSRAEL